MSKIAIVTGTTREGRNNIQVAEFLLNYAKENVQGHEFELLDIKEFDLPRFEGNYIPGMLGGKYPDPKVQKWADKVSEFDGYVFVTPEYNKALSSSLKDALDHISGEFNNKAAAIVSYGGSLGLSANVFLRVILANFKLAVTSQQVQFSLNTDFVNMAEFKPADYHAGSLNMMFNEVTTWADALKTIR
ncbi:NADPH-dependent FMN reductase [Eremococcus coleocola]|uniref:Flavin reductase n=1 Tax=Eremococcus coleocola ACS-139-V-Col8 TaxID=908337 RepID=E4KRC6_9LACT|nr:NAD(P)H-dependent oxidoreductase [Eremococcus coleocola]EFR30528.1 flavin reductase [Eremococcus coleocola ACS-139-V-Col8]